MRYRCVLPFHPTIRPGSSLRKHPFLLALLRWERFARPQRRWAWRNGCFRSQSGQQFKFMSKMTMGQLSANKKGADILVYPIMKSFYLMSFFVTRQQLNPLFPCVINKQSVNVLNIKIVLRANHCLDRSFGF